MYRNCIKIPIIIECKRNTDYNCNFELSIPYNNKYNYSIDQIIIDIIQYIQKKYIKFK